MSRLQLKIAKDAAICYSMPIILVTRNPQPKRGFQCQKFHLKKPIHLMMYY